MAAASSSAPPPLYRQSKLGDALVESLDELVKGGRLPPALALKVLSEFDSVFLAALQSKVTGKATFRGRLDTYRFCDGVWTFILTDAVFRLAGGRGRPARDVASKRIKVVAVDARLAKP